MMKRNKTKGVLKSGKIYSAQAYLELVLGECYILDHKKTGTFSDRENSYN